MFGLKVGIGFSACEVVLQVVVLHLQGNGVTRVDDGLHIGVIIRSRLVHQQSEGIHHTDRNTCTEQIIKRVISVFHHIVQKTGNLFFVSLPHQPYSKGMEYNGVTITVELSSMGCGSDAEGNVYWVHCIYYLYDYLFFFLMYSIYRCRIGNVTPDTSNISFLLIPLFITMNQLHKRIEAHICQCHIAIL